MTEHEARLERLQALRDQGADPFAETKFDRTHKLAELAKRFDELEGSPVRVCGRIMARRGHGKATFIDLADVSGRFQVFASVDSLGEAAYAALDNIDIADFIGVTGDAFRTRRGEMSVRADSVRLLSKALRPLPEKWHGLTDVETRFRRRYLDLVINPEVRDLFVRRSRMIEAIRATLVNRDFVEVETPMMQAIPGGATAQPFATHLNALDMDLFLRVAPELFLKRLIVGGFERVFEINRNFRNEGMDRNHNPEFTMLEAYQAYTDYQGMMELVEAIVASAAQAVCGSLVVSHAGREVDLTPPWRRISMIDALKEYAAVDWADLTDDDAAARVAKERELKLDRKPTVATVVKKLVDELVEPNLVDPTHLVDHPVVMSPLAKRDPERPELTQRFESFVSGVELANAFSELNDPIDQRGRFEHQVAEKDAGDEEAHPMDEDFIEALEHGMPPTGGLGIGMDRLFMLLTDTHTIREVILFPLMKPEE